MTLEYLSDSSLSDFSCAIEAIGEKERERLSNAESYLPEKSEEFYKFCISSAGILNKELSAGGLANMIYRVLEDLNSKKIPFAGVKDEKGEEKNQKFFFELSERGYSEIKNEIPNIIKQVIFPHKKDFAELAVRDYNDLLNKEKIKKP